MDIRSAKRKYASHKGQAKKRNIDWLFTFESWIHMWINSGKWEERGNKGHQYCMARKGDQGPYSPDNVIIKTTNQNKAECRELGNASLPPSRLGKKNGAKWYEAMAKMNTPERAAKIRRGMTKVWEARKAAMLKG
jgi:hypothetical protein